jgi:hypothetical protein
LREGFIAQDDITRLGVRRIYLLLVKFGEGSFGGLCLFAFGVELEVGIELGDGFVLFLHLLRYLGEGKVSEGVVGLDFDGVFGAKVGAGEVVVVHVELGYGDVLVDALIVGLNSLYLGETTMGGGTLGAGWQVWGAAGVVVGGSGAGAAAFAGVVAG